MSYIVHKRYKKQSLSDKVNIPYGTKIECYNNVLYYDNKPLCYTTSQDAYDYFSVDDDDCGLERGKLVKEIIKILAKSDNNHQTRWDKIWEDKSLNKFRRKDIEDYWLWSKEFYEAPIEDLKYILEKIQNVS